MIDRDARTKRRLVEVVLVGCVGILGPAAAWAAPDADLDGVPDAVDNCSQVPNGPGQDPARGCVSGCVGDQIDTDADGYGNVCDADVDNDGLVGGPDFTKYSSAFGKTECDADFDPDLDLTGDGVIGGTDQLILYAQYGGAPGPSGLACAGSAPCCPEHSTWDATSEVCVFEPFVDVEVTSGCGEPVVAECPHGYQVVGGGVEFPNQEDACLMSGGYPKAFQKIHGFSSYPRDNGWYCRIDSRLADCTARCAHRETVGIHSYRLETTFDRGHRMGAKSSGFTGDTSSTVTCPAGTTLIGGGIESEAVWHIFEFDQNIETDREEYRVLATYMKDADSWRCRSVSADHWGWCHAMCVPDEQLARVSLSLQEARGEPEVSCPAGSSVIGGGFNFCFDGTCDKIDEAIARPLAATNGYRIEIGFKDTSNTTPERIDVQAVCAEVLP